MHQNSQTPKVKIFWPTTEAPDIFETLYSYDFCRKISRRYCLPLLESEDRWINYEGRKDLLNQVAAATDSLNIVITEPEVIISYYFLERMIRMANQGIEIGGPVFNLTAFKDQQAPLPIPYCNSSTFEEVTDTFFTPLGNSYKQTNILDPVCFFLNRGAGWALKDILSGDILSGLSAEIDSGALVHRFSDYYFSERKDLVDLIPEHIHRVLDVGCAMGGYGKALKACRPDIHLIGVEPNPYMADLAESYYDEMIVDTIENVSFTPPVDLINCGDVIEHIFHPWRMLKKLEGLLRDSGYLVFSIPNAGHWSIVKDLLKGKFEYIPVGLQCVTHIRWFTENSIREMMEESGFHIEVFQREKMPATPDGEKFITDVCTAGFGDRQSLETFEYTVRAVKK